MLGVHTPETGYEADLANVRSAVREDGFTFPIAVDNSHRIWNDWGNQYWPAVYLIDKKGVVRYRWIGELGYDGADGDRIMREKIQELLNEK